MAVTEGRIDFPGFIASITHDMKNSLGMLINTLDEVLGDCITENCTSYPLLSQVQYEAKRVNNNLIQLLTLYKMDTAQFMLNISQHSVAEIIDETVLQNKPLLDFKGIEISTECSEDLFWFFDSDLISGVINNILNNSFRYTKDKIKIAAHEEREALVIRLEDNGKGYPAEMLEAQTSSRVSFKTGSTGLGLYFASIVASMHKNKGKEGFIALRNGGEFGGGCFNIILP
ncbi:MAG: HAMP domain-containing histidine kinase [Candidatus Tectomicrobia bacterium]|uniref:HAMP domain-containing histidine kinase n=1 Tax=Tectimicrobiota bacterium TaxID=2528274 RepID=A0A933LQP2_UNCTE|nr:HAMP domain-containing histidine kinase [Candidatus Tectomicrobia bacterium]